MPMYDRACKNEHYLMDTYEQIKAETPLCKECNEPMPRVLLPRRTGTVIQDSIEGGIWIRHGICNEDGSPRKYYSHSEMRAEAKRRGLVNYVEHVGVPGSDKSRHTVKWT